MVSCLDHAAEYPSVLIAHAFRTAASYVEAATLARVTAGLPPQVANRGYEARTEVQLSYVNLSWEWRGLFHDGGVMGHFRRGADDVRSRGLSGRSGTPFETSGNSQNRKFAALRTSRRVSL